MEVSATWHLSARSLKWQNSHLHKMPMLETRQTQVHRSQSLPLPNLRNPEFLNPEMNDEPLGT